MKRRGWFLFLVAASAVTSLAGWHFLPRFVPSAATPSAGQTSSPVPEAENKLVVCWGYADLEEGVTLLHPSQSGRVAEVPVKENQTVPAGAVLLRLDDRAARFRVTEARAVLDASLALLAKAEKGSEQHRVRIGEQELALKVARDRTAVAQHTLAARRERQRTEAIGRHRPDPVTSQEVASAVERVNELHNVEKLEEKKLSALQLRDPLIDVVHAKADVDTMRARLLQAEQALGEHVLRAPEAGKVLRVYATPGELLSAQPKKMAVHFCPDRPRVIRAEVEQQFAGRMQVGLPALVEDDGPAGGTWHGHVMRVADWYTQRRLVNEEQLQLKDVRTLECLIALDTGQPPLRIGQRVRVTITDAAPKTRLANRGKAPGDHLLGEE
jgi:multidrug resistance efflux pump